MKTTLQRLGQMKLMAACIVLLLSVGVLFACDTASNATNTGSLVKGTVTSVPTAATYHVGQQVKTGNWIVMFNAATVSKGTQFERPQGQFLVLDFSLVNQDSAPHSLSTLLQFTLKDSQGQKYDQAFVTLPNTHDLNGDVEAGANVRGQIVYDVPLGQHQYTCAFQADPFTAGAVVFDVSV